MNELKQEQHEPTSKVILMRIIQLNEAIARQNALIVQALSLPTMIYKPEDVND